MGGGKDLLRPALSLVELLVVIAILTILAGLMLPGVQSVRAAAARTDCQSRMRQLTIATQNYHAVHRHYPRGVDYPFSKSETDAHIRDAGLSWQTSLLPFVEQDSLWQRAIVAHGVSASGDTQEHFAVAGHTVSVFRCPVDGRQFGQFPPSAGADVPDWGLTNFLGVAGTGLDKNDGMFHASLRVTSTDVLDGTSNTIMIGERPTGPFGAGSSWYSGWGTFRFFKGQLMPVNADWANAPPDVAVCPTMTVFQSGKYDDPCHHYHFWSMHPGGANFAFADGSVKFLRYSAVSVLPALATRAGGEVIVGDW